MEYKFTMTGTHNTVNKVFHVVALEAYYSLSAVKLDKELIGKHSSVKHPAGMVQNYFFFLFHFYENELQLPSRM